MPSNNENTDQTKNPSSIYYLHPSDNTSIKRVANPLPFSRSGYGDWRRNMIIGLISKNKMPFVDGTLNKPSANSPNLRAWERCNNIVIGWIISCLDQMNAKSIMYYRTASEVWVDLEERLGQSSAAQFYSLHEHC